MNRTLSLILLSAFMLAAGVGIGITIGLVATPDPVPSSLRSDLPLFIPAGADGQMFVAPPTRAELVDAKQPSFKTIALSD